MAIEGGTEVVDGGAPPSDGAAKPDVGNTGGQPDKPAAPGRDYDKEIGGLRADLQKERKARQEREAELNRHKTELEAERRRVQALAGVTVKSKEEQDDEAIREAFGKKFPHLAGLTEEDIKAIREIREQQKMLLENTELQWERHNDNVINSLSTTIAKEIGGKLTDRQTERMVDAYAAYCKANPDALRRHQRGDLSLAEEFAKEWAEDWFEPARRKVTQQEVQRQRVVPSGKDRGIVTHNDQKIDVNDPKAVEDLLVKGFKERGGTFGR